MRGSGLDVSDGRGAQHGMPMSDAIREVARLTGLASSTVRATRAPIT